MSIDKISSSKRRHLIQRIKRIQRVANVKENTYYDNRGLTEEEQTGEIAANIREPINNVSAKEVFDRARAANARSKIYNQLQTKGNDEVKESEKDKVRKFKGAFKSEKSNIQHLVQENNKEVEQEEIEEQEL